MMLRGWSSGTLPNLEQQIFIVTGANSGLGRVTALSLARAGAQVIFACRNVGAGQAVIARDLDRIAAPRCYVRMLDLASLDSVSVFANNITSEFGIINGLVNNAGIMGVPTRRITADGFELQFGTNHLSHFALTARLFNRLHRMARIVTVSSINARIGSLDFDDLQAQRAYDPWSAYSASKLANLSFALTLDRRLRAARSGISSIAAHPGVALTRLVETGPQIDGPSEYALKLKDEVASYAQSDIAGAASILCACASPQVDSGDYIGPDGPEELRGAPTKLQPCPQAMDPSVGDRLWTVSEALTRCEFGVR